MHYRNGLIAALVILSARGLGASPVTLTANPAQSQVTAGLCLTITSTQCDSDVSPVGGQIVASLDCLTAPTAVTISDFNLAVLESIELNLNYGPFVGQFNAVATGVQINYATPGTPLPPAPLTNNAFAYQGVPANAAGQLNYNATILVCVALAGAGQPCNAALDLSTFILNPVALTGTVTVNGRDVLMTVNVNLSAPIDPANPGLGTLTITGSVQAAGTVPLPSIETFVGVLLQTIEDADLACESDLNGDGAANGLDIPEYVQALLSP
jgi:hypothetical protein